MQRLYTTIPDLLLSKPLSLILENKVGGNLMQRLYTTIPDLLLSDFITPIGDFFIDKYEKFAMFFVQNLKDLL